MLHHPSQPLAWFYSATVAWFYSGVDNRGHFQSGAAVRLAARLADCMGRLHAAGIVFCDLNPKNIHVSRDLNEVYFLDADGYQAALGGTPIPSRGVTEGYASPAAIANHTANPAALRSVDDDNFVLAILVFQLLLDRAHPFSTGPRYTEHPAAGLNDNIAARRFAFADVARYHPETEAASLCARLVTPLKSAFHRSFIGRHPVTASEWAQLIATHMAAPLAVTATPEPNAAALNYSTPVSSSAARQSRRTPSRPLRSPSVPASSSTTSGKGASGMVATARKAVVVLVAVPLAFAAVRSLRTEPVSAPHHVELAEVVDTPRASPPERTRIINATRSPVVERMLTELPVTLDDINATVRRKRARRS